MTVEYQPQTAAATLERIREGVDPWVAIGQFLDDWRRLDVASRPNLIVEPPPPVSPDHARCAALLAAAVEWLCAHEGFPLARWTHRPEYYLAEPWFLYPGWRLRAWQLFETPVPFRLHNVFGGDRILHRV